MTSYPAGTVAGLIASEHVSPATRAALTARMAAGRTTPRWFDPPTFAVLTAVCARLVPPGVDVAGTIDARLAEGRGNGWRYADQPEDGEAYAAGLGRLADAGFIALDAAAQDAMLVETQANDARFFEELLTEAVEAHYAHPLAQEAIGYAGMADLPGWTAIGLDEREAREPAERR